MEVLQYYFALPPIGGCGLDRFADQPRTAGQFENNVKPAESRLLGPPLDLRLTGEVGVGSFVAKGGCAVSFAGSILNKGIIRRRVVGFHTVLARTVQGQYYFWIDDMLLRDGRGSGRLPKIFAEEQRGLPASATLPDCADITPMAVSMSRYRNVIRP